MTDLLDLAVEAHGGLERWRTIEAVAATFRAGGSLFVLKGQPDALAGPVTATVETTRSRLTFEPFAGGRGVFEPDRVAVTTADGSERKRTSPRAAFDGHTLASPWDDLHLLYFAGYAMWNYICVPFVLTWPGFAADEIEPWHEGSETWRRLRVEFPSQVPTHSREQVLSFDDRGRLRRHDYTADIVSPAGPIPVAHYCEEHRTFSGLVVPTRRRAFTRREDNTPVPEEVVVAIDIDAVTVA
jgi:hypothetical protein